MITVPQSFLDMPRWWNDTTGSVWLDQLPSLVAEQCSRWSLTLDGHVSHGSNALVVPVRRAGELGALRLAPPGDDVTSEAAALSHWNGRGVVKLLDFAPDAGASLLERLDSERSLLNEPILESVGILGGLARLLAIPAPQTAQSTQQIAADAEISFSLDWHNLHRPTPRALLYKACAAASTLANRSPQLLSVDGDLHFEQVLGGTRYPWIVVDPVPFQGDPEYDLGRVLWSRLDELATDQQVFDAFDAFVAAADVPADRARSWVVVRAMSYLLWGLHHGLTWDPPKCRRLLELFT
ncbi:aminoglycoside phosphotransferase family protein [Cryobacterium sp. CG_9.6]|uniref:aminoglycoside phosphotransferase family protein n=1 Tax=Cryobacterium sp. CG_9.6 TaxID=2760710 RepID=UPI0024772C84|nr:aminoglycoside phosphotransferase family protein [Cryobacterium sp. CG_9.6]MDH6236406.1 streptomycin 6-kinase [Cryobacterium sp. CG_9.6]